MHVRISYPDTNAERAILRLARAESGQTGQPSKEANLLTQQSIFEARQSVSALHMAEAVEEYIIQLVMATREPQRYGDDLARWIGFGASPRGTIALDKCARAHAWLQGKDFVSPDDVQAVIHDTLRHRILLTFEAEAEGLNSDKIIDELLNRVPVA
jgi:MoxR-like ATPase